MSAGEASYSGRFLGQLLGRGQASQPEIVFMIRAGFRLYQTKAEHESFVRGFYRAMSQCEQNDSDASAVIDLAIEESAA